MGQTCSSTASTSLIAVHYPVEAQSEIDPEKAPENLARIEALAMGFLAILENQTGPLPRVGLYARVLTPHPHTIGMQLRQLQEFLERRRWQETLVVEEFASGSKRCRSREIDYRRQISGPAVSLALRSPFPAQKSSLKSSQGTSGFLKVSESLKTAPGASCGATSL